MRAGSRHCQYYPTLRLVQTRCSTAAAQAGSSRAAVTDRYGLRFGQPVPGNYPSAMRVALFSPVWFPVPPVRYGGIEAIVHLLADGLVDAGVDVTLFASGDSQTKASLVSAFDSAPSERIGESYWELQHLLPFLERADEFDVVHDHSGLVGLTTLGLTWCPT